jgi:Family of unknown function (DUF5989)
MRKRGYAFKLLGEFVGFARQNRAYWLIPLILLLGIAGLVIVAGQSAAPLLYTLF